MTDRPKIHGLKGGADEMSPEQRELVSALREVLDLALAGAVKSVIGIVELNAPDGEVGGYFEPLFAGVVENVDGACRRLDELRVMGDSLDGTSWLGADEDEDDPTDGSQ